LSLRPLLRATLRERRRVSRDPRDKACDGVYGLVDGKLDGRHGSVGHLRRQFGGYCYIAGFDVPISDTSAKADGVAPAIIATTSSLRIRRILVCMKPLPDFFVNRTSWYEPDKWFRSSFSVAPRESGPGPQTQCWAPWVPAFAGMTIIVCGYHLSEPDH